MVLTKREKSQIKNLSFFKAFGIIVSLFGLSGLFIGVYSAFFREMSPDSRPLIFILTLLSIVISILGYLLTNAYRLIEKLYKNHQT